MYGREYFHESAVKDIVDILTSLKDFDEVQFINNANAKRSFKSITSATKDLILTFPVMVSTDIDPDNAIMIAKAQEKKMASLLHILFTAISVGNNEDVFDYVRKFHSNVGSMSGTLDSYADSLDKLATTFGESYDQTLKIDHDVLETVLEELKESNYTLPDNVNESSLESYKVVPGYRTGHNDMIIKEATLHDSSRGDTNIDIDIDDDNLSRGNAQNYAQGLLPNYGLNYDTDSDYIKDNITRNQDGTYTLRVQGDSGATLTMNQDEYNRLNRLVGYNNNNNRPRETINREIKQSANLGSRNMNSADFAKYMESMTKAHNAVVLNNEYKKANELQPTMMVVNFMRHSEETGDYINTAVIGIKCKIYPVTSADIVNRISGKLKDKSFLTNFVRATTNEIAFFRDFLFAVDQAKFDAKSYGRQASSNKMWKVLERRSVKSKFRRSLKMYNDATAISTLVLSENDAEYLKKVHSIDILDVRKARKILDEYNFMCIVVANQSTEVASFLYDTGDDTYEMIPFSGLEREASDNSYKKMVNLLSKVSR